MTSTEIRQKAADLIEERGWWQGDFEGPRGELCAIAAIAVAVGIPADAGEADWVGLPNNTVLQLEVELDDEVAWWNDSPGRTKTEVLAALRGQS